jgi:hypothetical protein
MRFFVVSTLGLLVVLTATESADARGGRGFGRSMKTTSYTRPSSPPAAQTKPTPAVRGMLFVPMRSGAPRDQAGVSAYQPREATSGGSPLAELPAAPRPWCEDGKVANGFCVLN